MSLTLTDLITLSLAGGALTDVWFNGSIFAGPRAYFEARDSEPLDEGGSESAESRPAGEESPGWVRFLDKYCPDWLAELVTCPFCFSHHAVIWPAILLLIPAIFLWHPWSSLLRLPLYILAAVRLGWIVNAGLPGGAQYERGE